MVPRWLLRLGLCCLLVGAIAPAVAAPPPRPLCDACGDGFEATAAAHGVEVTVERSTATVAVSGNGTATWTVRNRLADSAGADRLRANRTLRSEVAGGALRDTEFLTANVSADGVLMLRYRDPDFASPSVAGTLRSGAFTEAYGYRNLDGLGADRLAVAAPEGTRVGWTVPGATVADDGRTMTLTAFDRGRFVTFVPRDAALGPLWSALAVGAVVGPAVATNAVVLVALPTALFALLVAASASPLWLDRLARRARDAAGAVPAAAGALLAVALAAGGGVSLLGGAAAPLVGAAVAFGALGVGFARPRVRERASYRTVVAGAALAGLLAAATTVAGAAVLDQNGLTRSLFSSLPFLVSLFALLPAGYAFGRERRRLGVATAAAGFALGTLPLAPLASPTVGPGSAVVLVAAAYAAAIAVVGSPLLIAGAALAAE